MEALAPGAPDRIRAACQARIRQRLPVPVVGIAEDAIAAMVDPILAAFFEWHDGSMQREAVKLELAGAGRAVSERLAWGLIDEVVVCLVETIVADATEHGWTDAPWAARGAVEVSNLFYDGYWVFDGRSGYEQALRFGRLAERMPSPVFLADGDGALTFVNEALAGLLGVEAGDLIGRQVGAVLPIGEGVELSDGFEAEFAYERSDDEVRHLSVSVLMIPGEHTFEYFGSVQDHTSEVVLKQTRDQVVATISHELRTPLTAVLGYTELLIAGDGSAMTEAERSAALSTMRDEAELLLRLVHDLVDFTHLETGRIDVEPTAFLIADAIEAAARRTFVGTDDLPHLDVDADLEVLADRRRLEQVLTNLLTNAHRYGGPTIEVQAHARHRDILIRVRDDGPGIAHEGRHRVFETFYQGHDRVGLGAGIGLALCRAIVRAHGGTISLEDRSGASFLIELPEAAG